MKTNLTPITPWYAKPAPPVDGKPAWYACYWIPGKGSKRVSSAYGPILYATRADALKQAKAARAALMERAK